MAVSEYDRGVAAGLEMVRRHVLEHPEWTHDRVLDFLQGCEQLLATQARIGDAASH